MNKISQQKMTEMFQEKKPDYMLWMCSTCNIWRRTLRETIFKGLEQNYDTSCLTSILHIWINIFYYITIHACECKQLC